ncbi:MAG: hypothetical protein EXQ74_00155 [Thermoleophilia bacterium]|nr:hypothetical protein [Thermoleophilia bacterium]
MTGGTPIVLFVCVQNAGRSQMAAALFQRAVGDRAVAVSAGTRPAAAVHSAVVSAMDEIGIDLSAAVPRELTDDLQRSADHAVTMGCGDACPLVQASVTAWSVEDPYGRPMDEVRRIRDFIVGLTETLVRDLGLASRT